MNGFKVAPKDPEDETSNVYLVKSLPLIKKATFSINGKKSEEIIFVDFYELLDIINQNLDFDKQKEETKDEGGVKLLHKDVLRPSKIY